MSFVQRQTVLAWCTFRCFSTDTDRADVSCAINQRSTRIVAGQGRDASQPAALDILHPAVVAL